MLADCIARKSDNKPIPGDPIQMIGNVARAMAYVDEVGHVGGEITEQLICELQQMSKLGVVRLGEDLCVVDPGMPDRALA